jgi:hypothetical protein
MQRQRQLQQHHHCPQLLKWQRRPDPPPQNVPASIVAAGKECRCPLWYIPVCGVDGNTCESGPAPQAGRDCVPVSARMLNCLVCFLATPGAPSPGPACAVFAIRTRAPSMRRRLLPPPRSFWLPAEPRRPRPRPRRPQTRTSAPPSAPASRLTTRGSASAPAPAPCPATTRARTAASLPTALARRAAAGRTTSRCAASTASPTVTRAPPSVPTRRRHTPAPALQVGPLQGCTCAHEAWPGGGGGRCTSAGAFDYWPAAPALRFHEV